MKNEETGLRKEDRGSSFGDKIFEVFLKEIECITDRSFGTAPDDFNEQELAIDFIHVTFFCVSSVIDSIENSEEKLKFMQRITKEMHPLLAKIEIDWDILFKKDDSMFYHVANPYLLEQLIFLCKQIVKFPITKTPRLVEKAIDS
jgi:hypothetical protein